MKKIATSLLFCLFITIAGFSQKIEGQWRGFFDGNGDIVLTGGNNTEYVLELEIKGNKISGISYSYFQNRRYYVMCSLSGTYLKTGNNLKVTETARIKGNTPPDFSDCLQTHYLTYKKEGNVEKLTGQWEPAPGQRGGCGTGSTTLTRRTLSKDLSSFKASGNNPVVVQKKPVSKMPSFPDLNKKKNQDTIARASKKPALVKLPVTKAPPVASKKTNPVKPSITKPAAPVAGEQPAKKAVIEPIQAEIPLESPGKPALNFEKRKSEILKTIEIENETFKVQLYDNGEVDGDSVSLFYNGKLILLHKRLSEKPITLTLDATTDKASNELTMYADNLGEIPPNTALMVVTDGDKRYEVRISSDLKNSGTINFIHKPRTQ
jgi:hypothetical protein